MSEEERLATSGIIDAEDLTLGDDDDATELLLAKEPLTDEECDSPNPRLGDLRFSMERSPATNHGVDLESAVRKLRKASVLRPKKFSPTVRGRFIAFRLHERATEILAVISETSPPTFSGEYVSKELRTDDEVDGDEVSEAQSDITCIS